MIRKSCEQRGQQPSRLVESCGCRVGTLNHAKYGVLGWHVVEKNARRRSIWARARWVSSASRGGWSGGLPPFLFGLSRWRTRSIAEHGGGGWGVEVLCGRGSSLFQLADSHVLGEDVCYGLWRRSSRAGKPFFVCLAVEIVPCICHFVHAGPSVLYPRF